MERVDNLYKDLQRSISGDVSIDIMTRHVYSVDASIYEILPEVVVTPKTTQDIQATIQIANQYKLPLAARGAATGITGGCLGHGIVIDTSKYLNRILEINYEQEYVICEPGVIQDQLNAALKEHHYRLGPDTSTGNRATIGGMLANNAAGARSLFYGKMVDHILEVDILLSNGEHITLGNNTLSNRDLHQKILKIKEQYQEEILKHFPKLPRRVSGYNLDALLSESPNFAKLIAGSEGTLGIITKMKLRICKKPKEVYLSILFFEDMIECLKHIKNILEYSPLSVEMIDDKIIEAAKRSPTMQDKLPWLTTTPKIILAVEFQSNHADLLIIKINEFENKMSELGIGSFRKSLLNKNEMSQFWSLRKAGLGLLLSKRTYSRAIAFIEDISIPPEKLASFMEKFLSLLQKYQRDAGIYGHVGSGCMHIRPYIDLRDPKEITLIEKIMIEVTDLLIESSGSLSGEHGDGYIRSWLNEKLFGKNLYQAFCEIKQAFDPINLMNPNKIVNAFSWNHHLRLDPTVVHNKLDTFLDFSKEGGFELAADLCNGNGLCRKPETLMCPSFQATLDEYDTTRARAQSLRAIINGRLSKAEYSQKNIHDVMDLCLECKGCKAECPSQVDMAKMKSEMLYQYQKNNGIPFRSQLFANIGLFNKIFSPCASLTNKFLESQFSKALLKFIGISDQRALPKLAKEPFSKWVNKNHHQANTSPTVVLYNDTFTEYNYPEIGIAAYHVLQNLGYHVVVPTWSCCGRPMISKGLLKQAEKASKKMIQSLIEYAKKGTSIVVLEPSCLSTFIDDYHSFFKNQDDVKKDIHLISQACLSLEEFVFKHFEKQGISDHFKRNSTLHLIFHRHCHQKALEHNNFLSKLMNLININAIEIPSGCCGVAGSFGYEQEHYALSMKIGELHLFPFIRKQPKNVIIIANGVSCRNQIAQGTDRKALHIAEFLYSRMRFNN